MLVQLGRAVGHVRAEERVALLAEDQAHREDDVAARRQRGDVAGHQVLRVGDVEEVQQHGHDQAGRLGEVDALRHPGEDPGRVTHVAVYDRRAGVALASSASRCETTTGSLSMYATRASGWTSRATSPVVGDVGIPQPTSMNCRIPWLGAHVT